MKQLYRGALCAVAIVLTCGGTCMLLAGVPAVKRESVSEPLYQVVSPEIPTQTFFAGKVIPLDRYDLRERMDRELMAFTYMHSTTMLTIKRANRYFPVVEPILRAHGVPDDFKYLMVVESNLNPQAVSPVGAAGLWQFMDTTAKQFGLEVNRNVDERYNIAKATRSACLYLKSAYVKYGDWMAAAASYNAGQGRISSSLSQQKEGRALDLWLNDETSRYLFRILAAKELFQDPKNYGFRLQAHQLYPPILHTEIDVATAIPDLVLFAKEKGLSYAQLKTANLWLRGQSLENKQNRTYTLHLPTQEGMNYNPQAIQPHSKSWVVGD